MSCDPIGRALAEWETSTLGVPLVLAAGRIGYLGPRGTFSEEALRAALQGAPPFAGGPAEDGRDGRADRAVANADNEPGGRELIGFPSLADTIQAVAEGDVDCVVVPIENSIEGSVSVTVDVLVHEVHNLQVVREVRHPIRHRLLARPGVRMDDIEKVVSHPHANAQCRVWLRKHLPGVEVEAANSTANAVERVARSDAPWAAIGTALAAEANGCVILRDNIEDHDDNETRFIFLSRTRERQDLPEPYKTSVVCRILKDQPGALLLILQEFAHRYINLTKIESRPSKQGLGDYLFLIDMEGCVTDPRVADALRCLNCKLLEVKVLGSYPVGPPPRRSDSF